PWAILAAAVAHTRAGAAAFLGAYLLLRLLMAYIAGVWGVGDGLLRRRLYLVPLRDAINFLVWLASFASSRIIWHGTVFTIDHGHMVAVNPPGSQEPTSAAPASR